MLDDASAIDRRFGEYDWRFLSKVVVSDTMNADDIHHAGARALAEWAEENLGPLSIGPQAGLVDRYRQMQTERLHPSREAANESCISLGRQYAPRPSPDDQSNSNQISADVTGAGRSVWGSPCPDVDRRVLQFLQSGRKPVARAIMLARSRALSGRNRVYSPSDGCGHRGNRKG